MALIDFGISLESGEAVAKMQVRCTSDFDFLHSLLNKLGSSLVLGRDGGGF